MNINCQQFNAALGAYCHQISESVLLVSTPLVFPDNTPVNLYVESSNNTITLTDDGDTLMRLHGIGLGDNARMASSINNRATAHGGALENGCLVFRSISLRESYVSYLKTMIEIINYELENTALPNETITAINDVIIELERRNPGCCIERDVTITGTTGAKYTFPIRANDRLIGVTRPSHQATGAVLRRVADIEKAGCSPPLIIIDDSDNIELGMREVSLIGTFVPAMLLTTLKAESSPLSLSHH